MIIRALGAGVAVSVLAGVAGTAAAAASADAQRLTNFDRYRTELRAQAPLLATKSAYAGVLPAQVDTRMGLPTFLWARPNDRAAVVGPLQPRAMLDARARDYLRQRADELQLSEASIANAELVEAQYNGHGPAVVRLRQRVNGLPVFNRWLNVMLDRSGKPVAVSGYFATATTAAAPVSGFLTSSAQAVLAAWQNLGGDGLTLDQLVSTGLRGGYEYFERPRLTGLTGLARPPRVRPLYYPRVDRLEPAYYVELFGTSAGAGDVAHAVVVSAHDGQPLFRKDLTAGAAYTYRVFADESGEQAPFDSPLGNGYTPYPGADPFDQPPRVGQASTLVTLSHGPISTGDPWIAESGVQTTTGNNVDAYIDSGIGVFLPLVLPVRTPGDGFVPGTGDVRATATGPDTFDYAITGDEDPSHENAILAANVNLFYVNNWLHDAWYDHGLNEEAGNAQNDNFGRGGVDGDALDVEGQDSSGRNNANMATPSDGSAPRMQMYLFDGALLGEVTVLDPAPLGTFKFSGASFGPQTFDRSGEVALANDVFGAPTDGCSGVETPPDPLLGISQTIANPVPDPRLFGKIALIDRGTCSFTNKALFATLSGAIGMIIVNNGDGNPSAMGNADVPLDIVSTDRVYQIPSVMIRRDDGQALKDALAAGQTVTMRLKRDPSIDRDGTFDNQVIAHEFFHYVSNRLVGDASGLSNNQGGSMGEGWSDVAALILSVRTEDRSVPGNERWQGAYGVGHYATGDSYFAIRRVPYSTDFAINPLTFRHVANGEALPDTAPVAFGADGSTNAAVHSSGEIWANAVWNCYAGLPNDPRHAFVEARSRMQDYLIAGLKMTPVAPTFTEARDGLLAAAMARDATDFARCANGFAVRGMGKNAVSPERDSTDHVGVVENFDAFAPLPADEVGGSESDRDDARFGGAIAPGLMLMLLALGLLRARRDQARGGRASRSAIARIACAL